MIEGAEEVIFKARHWRARIDAREFSRGEAITESLVALLQTHLKGDYNSMATYPDGTLLKPAVPKLIGCKVVSAGGYQTPQPSPAWD